MPAGRLGGPLWEPLCYAPKLGRFVCRQCSFAMPSSDRPEVLLIRLFRLGRRLWCDAIDDSRWPEASGTARAPISLKPRNS